jgi:outer membrane protein assembly factor BamB
MKSARLHVLLVSFFCFSIWAGDWLQYRGPNHDGISNESIRTNWTEVQPRQIWKVPLDPGLSSFSVSGGRVYTQVRRTISGQDQEVCIALNADTGQELWATPLGIADYPNGGVGSDDGPRSTPSVDGNFVYVLTSYLRLACFGANDGHVVWSRDLVADYGGTVISWQNAASPLLESGLIFLNCNATGNRLLALHEADGTEAWKGQDDPMTQASPVIATIAGVRQVIFFAQSGLVSVARDTGSFLWRYPFPFSVATAASPVVSNNIVYCSAAYGIGAGAVQVTNAGTQLASNEIWRTPGASMNHWATPVCLNGYLYGVYGQAGPTTSLRCIELATGNEMWRQPNPSGPGGVLAVSGLVLMLTEAGYVVLVNPDPAGYTELARYRALDGTSSSFAGLVRCWNVPAISNGRLYVRSTTEAVCLDVAPAAPPALKLSGSLSGSGLNFRLLIGNADGSPLDTNLVPNINLFATTNLTLGPGGWVPLTNPVVFTNNQLLLESPLGLPTPQLFFRAQARP